MESSREGERERKKLSEGEWRDGRAGGDVVAQIAAMLALLAALNRPPRMVGTLTWYAGPLFDNQPTASGELFNPDALTCAVRLKEWNGGLACGYGRGDCARAWLCGDAGCALVRLNDSGLFTHPLDCSPAVFEAVVGGRDVGVGEVRAWKLP